MNNQFTHLLSCSKHVLVLAVGGGNDSVSTLLLQKQLEKDYNFRPHRISVLAMLPDCLDYQNLEPTKVQDIYCITKDTTRSVLNKPISAFPEKIFAEHKNVISSLRVENIYGLSMRHGSEGVYKSLKTLFSIERFDLVLAVDVGGDFIAIPENIEVLSPMMDGYMMYALQKLYKYEHDNIPPIIYSVFGLGTDGESTPLHLEKALNSIPDIREHTFDYEQVKDVISFYRNVVEKNRYSRTADFTIREIENVPHDNPATFRGRFHIKTPQENKVYYGTFSHVQDAKYFGKYYLFQDVSNIKNMYAIPCNNGIEWFVRVQNQNTKINHELNGQTYSDLSIILSNEQLKNVSLFFGTPSRRFSQDTQKSIASDILSSILSQVYDVAIMYKQFEKDIITTDLYYHSINEDLIMISKHSFYLEELKAYLESL